MKIGIISDHRGYELRKEIINELKDYELVDLGTEETDSEVVDYPDYAFLLGEQLTRGEFDFGIAICGSGIGISIALNKVQGIRSAKVDSINDVIATRSDNDANVIAFSAETSLTQAVEYIKTFINTPFSGLERHRRRINKITSYENGEYNER